MRSVVVASSPPMIRALLDAIEADPPRHFADFGCGRGDVLRAVATRFPGMPCVGVDLDDDVLAYARDTVAGAGNVSLRQGDVLDHTGVAEDVAYLYLSGALNQRLGHALLEEGRCRRILTVRYPIAGAVASGRMGAGDSSIWVYQPGEVARWVEWDSRETRIWLPPAGAYLLTRALRVSVEAELTLEWRVLEGDPVVRSFEFGLRPARPGVPVMCDVLLDRPASRRSVVELTVLADGVPLVPAHVVTIVPVDRGAPREESRA